MFAQTLAHFDGLATVGCNTIRACSNHNNSIGTENASIETVSLEIQLVVFYQHKKLIRNVETTHSGEAAITVITIIVITGLEFV